MNDITLLLEKNGTSHRIPSHRRLARLVARALLLLPAFAAVGLAAEGAAPEDMGPVLPAIVATPPGCLFTSPYALNNGAYPEGLVVAGSVNCGSGSLPYTWTDGAWSALPMATEGYAESASDDLGEGVTITYVALDANQWHTLVAQPGQPLVELTPLAGKTFIGSSRVTEDGNYIVGGNSVGDLEPRGVRWARTDSGWSLPEDIGPGEAVATTADGGVVIGNTDPDTSFMDAGPWIWTANPGGGGDLQLIDAGARVEDIAHDGSMIVGSRGEPCVAPSTCDFFPAPVYWVREGDAWVMHDLQALDDVNSQATEVAVVAGETIIAGTGFTNQQGGILRVVAWLPDAAGNYGEPLRLEAIGGNFDSWSYIDDMNRNGVILGWSEVEPFGRTETVLWSLVEELPFQINAGISDAWYNSGTDGQGFFIIVWPDIRKVFLSWFTYDTERPDTSVPAVLGDPGHRWLTAQGSYGDNRAELEISMTEGGVFDSEDPVPFTTPDGTMVLELSSCIQGTVTYDIPSIGRQGVVPIQRITNDHVAYCESLSAQ